MTVIETKREVIDRMYECDICHKKTNFMNTCMYCGRHMCTDHDERVLNDPITGYDYGDYSMHMCTECYQIVKTGKIRESIESYRQKVVELENMAGEIYIAIKEACKHDK